MPSIAEIDSWYERRLSETRAEIERACRVQMEQDRQVERICRQIERDPGETPAHHVERVLAAVRFAFRAQATDLYREGCDQLAATAGAWDVALGRLTRPAVVVYPTEGL